MTGLSLLMMMMMMTLMNISEVECATFIPYPIVPPPAWLLPYTLSYSVLAFYFFLGELYDGVEPADDDDDDNDECL